MRAIATFIICCTLTYSLNAQHQSDGVKVYNTYCLTKLSNDSISLELNIMIVNADSIEYFYPKAFEQKIAGKSLYETYRLLKYHRVQDLTLDVGTVGYNSYDTLVAIKPSDTLVIKYTNIPLYTKPQKIVIDNYIFLSKQAIKSTAGGAKYLDRYVPGVKIIEYNLTYAKGKISDALVIRNYLNPPKASVVTQRSLCFLPECPPPSQAKCQKALCSWAVALAVLEAKVL